MRMVSTDTGCCGMKSLGGYCPKPLEQRAGYLNKKWTISIVVTIGNFSVLRFNDLLARHHAENACGQAPGAGTGNARGTASVR